MELSDRELAIRWWSRLSDDEKDELLKRFSLTRLISTLTGREIEWIWRKQQKL